MLQAMISWQKLKTEIPGSKYIGPTVMRAKVPGGWIVVIGGGGEKADSSLFVPDESHAWAEESD